MVHSNRSTKLFHRTVPNCTELTSTTLHIDLADLKCSPHDQLAFISIGWRWRWNEMSPIPFQFYRNGTMNSNEASLFSRASLGSETGADKKSAGFNTRPGRTFQQAPCAYSKLPAVHMLRQMINLTWEELSNWLDRIMYNVCNWYSATPAPQESKSRTLSQSTSRYCTCTQNALSMTAGRAQVLKKPSILVWHLVR